VAAWIASFSLVAFYKQPGGIRSRIGGRRKGGCSLIIGIRSNNTLIGTEGRVGGKSLNPLHGEGVVRMRQQAFVFKAPVPSIYRGAELSA